MPANPFLDPSFDIRWSQHLPELIAPAIETALAQGQAAIDEIANRDLNTLTYENTFLALENAAEELNYAWGKVTHLQSVADTPALRDAHNALLPAVSAFSARVSLNPGLWLRLKTFSATPAAAALTGIHRRYVDETLEEFRQAGADLPDEKRARLEALQTELAQLTQKYGDNVLDATNAWQLIVEDEARLRGLPAHAVAAAKRSAEEKGFGGPGKPAWRFTLPMTSQEPVMTYADDATLRQEVWTAATAVGAAAPHDNTSIVQQILALRDEKARLLEKQHFADLVLGRRMAGSGERALSFVEDMRSRAQDAFVRECAELEAFKAKQTGAPVEKLKAWEVGYWSEKLRQSRYDFDDEVLRPYLPMNRVIAGLFELAERVFNLKIVERSSHFVDVTSVKTTAGAASSSAPQSVSSDKSEVDGDLRAPSASPQSESSATSPKSASASTSAPNSVEVWHPEVKFYDMHDARGRHLGSFYADWHPREPKRGGAWMGYLVTGGPRPDGSRAPHLGYICGNMTPPVDGQPALLAHDEVETVFHEFGHLLHHLLGEVEIKSLNGVNVAWDFVELPSQIMENWCWERESLDLFARHHETGDPIPEDIFQKMTAAKNFRSACATMRQVQFARMDLVMHMRAKEFLDGDLEAKARALVADCMIPTEPQGRTIVKRFGHLFSDPVGYAAGYYSYKWAEVLDADAFTRFKIEGVFNSTVGAQFVEHILSRGNSADPAELYRRFMGRDPDIAALLKRNGLVAAA